MDESDVMITSTYSELAGPVKETLANVQAYVGENGVEVREPKLIDETEEGYEKRLRKLNLLSLAQEFADLQADQTLISDDDTDTASLGSVTPEALASPSSPSSSAIMTLEDSETPSCNSGSQSSLSNLGRSFLPSDDSTPEEPDKMSINVPWVAHSIEACSKAAKTDIPVFQSAVMQKKELFDDIEPTMPSLNWDKFEKLAKEAEQQKKASTAERKEILRRLANPQEEEEVELCPSPVGRFSNLRTNNSASLQVCFMNEVSQPQPDVIPKEDHKPDDVMMKQKRLQDEAQIALAQVKPMAHMQIQLEKNKNPPAPVAARIGLYDEAQMFTKRDLLDMNVARLQVMVNRLLAQIERLNEELMALLVERDDLHMEQDSILVDVEDLKRRSEEMGTLNGRGAPRAARDKRLQRR